MQMIYDIKETFRKGTSYAVFILGILFWLFLKKSDGFFECLGKLIMKNTFKFWLEIIFCAFCGNPGSKVARGVWVHPLMGFESPTLRSPARCHDH